ncbi:MAG TPA: hypothetical protein VIK18_03445 [Pirellulales bacterium]
MKRCAVLLAAVLWVAGSVVSARGDEALLNAIPDDALGLIVVNHLDDTTKKIEAVGAKLNVSLPSLLPTLKAITGVSAGVDENGTVAAVVMPQEDVATPPTIVIFVPVTDYAQLAAGLLPEDPQAEIISGRVAGQPMIVTQKGGFAVFARPMDEDVLKRVKAATRGIASDVQPVGDWLRQNDLVVLALSKGVRQAVNVMHKGIANAQENFPADQQALKPALALFELLNRSGDTIKDELTHVGLGVRIDREQDLLVSGQVAFKSGGTFSKAVTDAKWPQVPGLDNLPSDDYFLALSMVLPSSWSQGLMQASMAMAKLGANSPAGALSKEQIEKLFKLSGKSMQGVEGTAMTMSAPKGDDASLLTSARAVMYVDDAQKYLQRYRETMQALADLGAENPDAPLPTYEIAEIQVAGERGFQVQMDMAIAFKRQNLNNPVVEKIIEAVYGPEGKMTVCLAAANEHTIATSYDDKDSLEDLIQAIKKREPGLGQNEEIVNSNKLLPAAAAWKMYISPAGTIELAKWVLGKIGNQQTTLPAFPDTPPLAAGVNFTPTGAEARLALPSDLIDAIGAYVTKVRQMQAQ